MKFSSSTYNVGYPVYGSKFLNDTMLLVAGGGGEGNNGIPNKLTVLRVDFEKKKVIKRFREITLDPNDDSPTTLDASNNLILMGCNENSEKIRSGGGNQNLRKFVYENEHLRFVASVDFDGSVSPEDYTKLIYMSRDGSVGAIASSKAPTVIRIIDPRSLEEKYEIETGHDVKDMHFAPDGKVIGYITASTLEVISIVTGRFIIRKNDFDKNYILSKVRFLTDDVVLIAASLQKGTGVVLIKISLKSGSATVLKSKLVTNKFKGLTSMDVDVKNQLAVIAGNDNSIALVKLKDFSLGRMFKQVHSFAITRVAFSPNSRFIASVSAANTVNVIKVPDGFALSTSLGSKVWKFFINFILIIIIAFLGQLSYRYNLHDRCYKFLKHQYLARRNGSTGGVDILKQTTLVGDIVSEVTSTKAPNTSAGKIESYSLEGRNTAVTSKADSPDDDVWLSDTWAGSASASYTGTVNTQVIYTTSFSASPMIDDPTTSNSDQVSETSVSLSETATTEVSHSSSAAVTNHKVEREESIKHTENVSLDDSEKSRDERGTSHSKGLTTSVAQSVRALESDSLTQTLPESEHTSTPSKSESDSASFTEAAVGTSLLESLIDSQLEQTEKLQEPSQDPTAKSIGDATRTERAIEIGSSTADDIRMTSVAREDEEVKHELITSSGNLIENSATTVVSSSSLALSPASDSQSKETALHAKQKSESSVTETGKPESLASSTATATKDESQIELPSGAEMNYDLLEEKTPEPTEILGVEEDLTTPTDDLISVQDSTESKAAAIPLEEESLETGKQDKPSKTASKVEESQASTDDAMTGSRINELKVHIEKPVVPPTIIEASISNSESMVVDETEASQTSVDVITSRNEVQTSLERLQDTPSTKHADETVSLDNAEVSELPLEDNNEPVSTTSAKPSSTGESTSVTSSERGTNNVRKSHEWESSGQMSISTAHNEIAATEETSVVPEDAEYAISSNSQDAVVRDEL